MDRLQATRGPPLKLEDMISTFFHVGSDHTVFTGCSSESRMPEKGREPGTVSPWKEDWSCTAGIVTGHELTRLPGPRLFPAPAPQDVGHASHSSTPGRALDPASMQPPPSPPSCSSLNPRVIISLFFTLHPHLRVLTHVLKWIGALTPPRSSPPNPSLCVSADWTLLLCSARTPLQSNLCIS